MHPLSEKPLEVFRADLHCHSCCSDGSLSPVQLIDLAIDQGLSALSITDHDTVEAYQTAIAHAKKKGLYLGSGVEFSCQHEKKSVHVLGYDFCLEDPALLQYCDRLQAKRLHRNQEILHKLHRLRILIDESELLSHHANIKTIGRPHIAALMVQKGYVGSIQEAFQRYLGDGKCCFVPGEAFPIEEALQVIHQAGGKGFLAHPHLYEDILWIKQLLSLGFDGIECYYGRAPLRQEKRWLKLAEKLGLLQSGGSDFHGEAKPHVPLGCSWVSKEVFFSIFDRNLSGFTLIL